MTRRIPYEELRHELDLIGGSDTPERVAARLDTTPDAIAHALRRHHAPPHEIHRYATAARAALAAQEASRLPPPTDTPTPG